MNKAETQSAKLLRTIQELEEQAEIEKDNFRTGYHQLLENMKPVNLLKAGFERMKESPKLQVKAAAGVVGFALTLVAKRAITRKLEEPHSRKEQERISQASKVITPISKILKPVLSILATHFLDSRKRKHEV